MPRQLWNSKAVSLVASAAVTTSSNSGNLKGTANALLPSDAVTLILDVTAYTGTVGPNTLDVYLDSSPDGGTTWYPSVHFAQVTTSTDIQLVEMRPIGIGPTEVAVHTRWGATLVTTSIRAVNTVVAVDHRVRWAFTANASTQSATFAVWAICQPFGTYAT